MVPTAPVAAVVPALFRRGRPSLPVQPHPQGEFVLVVRFLIPRPVAAGGRELLQLLQPLLLAGLVIGFSR